MAGRVPAICSGELAPRFGGILTGLLHAGPMRGGWVYFMAHRPFGSLYVSVTNDIVRRTWEHRTGACEGFTKRYRLSMLVYYEWHEEIVGAIQRETNVKHWLRALRRWKLNLLESQNPGWEDLYPKLVG